LEENTLKQEETNKQKLEQVVSGDVLDDLENTIHQKNMGMCLPTNPFLASHSDFFIAKRIEK